MMDFLFSFMMVILIGYYLYIDISECNLKRKKELEEQKKIDEFCYSLNELREIFEIMNIKADIKQNDCKKYIL